MKNKDTPVPISIELILLMSNMRVSACAVKHVRSIPAARSDFLSIIVLLSFSFQSCPTLRLLILILDVSDVIMEQDLVCPDKVTDPLVPLMSTISAFSPLMSILLLDLGREYSLLTLQLKISQSDENSEFICKVLADTEAAVNVELLSNLRSKLSVASISFIRALDENPKDISIFFA